MKRALAEVDGRHTGQQPLILRDPAFEGVTIRVSRKSASWYVKYGKVLKKLGDVGNPDAKSEARRAGTIYAVRDAEELADRVRDMLKLGQDPSTYLTARSTGMTHEQAGGHAGTVAARADGAWTWERLVDQFLNEKIKKPTITSKGRVKPPSWKTEKEVVATLRHPELDHLKDTLVRDLRRGQIEAIRNKWNLAGRTGPQSKLVAYVKSSMKWAKRYHDEAGLSDVAPWWLELRAYQHATKVEAARTAGEVVAPPLTPAQVAKLLFLAEKHRVAERPSVDDRRPNLLATADITLSALWFIALTAQRTHASYATRVARIEDRTATDGWHEVSWLPVDMKSKRHFTLPITPDVYRRSIGRAMASPARRTTSQWVFASSREKLRGKEGRADKHISDTALNSVLNRLRGKGKTGSGVDLLKQAGLPHFTLHELRDALTTYLAADQSLPSSAASAILDHAPDGDEPAAREAQVTRDHYNKSQRLELKAAGLNIWSSAVLAEYEELLETERRAAGYKRLLSRRINVKPEHGWLFDHHLPALPGASQPIKMDLSKLSSGVDEDDDDGAFDAPEEEVA